MFSIPMVIIRGLCYDDRLCNAYRDSFDGALSPGSSETGVIAERWSVMARTPEATSTTNPSVSTRKKITATQKPYRPTCPRLGARGISVATSRSKARNSTATR